MLRVPFSRRRALSLLVIGLLVLLTCFITRPTPASAAVIMPLALEEMAEQAVAVVYARTTDVVSRFSTGSSGSGTGEGPIETIVHLKVFETVKGPERSELTLTVPGGTVDDLTLTVDYAPRFEPGGTYLIFLDDEGRVLRGYLGAKEVVQDRLPGLDRSLDEVLAIIGAEDGKVRRSQSREIQQSVAETAAAQAAAPQITGISPGSGSAGTGTVITISGRNFGSAQSTSRVEFFHYYSPSEGEERIPAEIVSWSDTSIRCIVPMAELFDHRVVSAGSGPVTVVTPAGSSNGYDFHVTFGYSGSKFGRASAVYKVNPKNADTSEASTEALVDAGAKTWNSASAFKFIDGGRTSVSTLPEYTGQDGQNTIFWSNDLQDGILASAYTLSSGATLIEADIAFNDADYIWGDGSGGTFDIQTVVTHELGHWLRLHDLYGNGDKDKVMYGFGRSGLEGRKRELTEADRAGIHWIYGDPVTLTKLSVKEGSSRGGTTVVVTGNNFTDVKQVTFGGIAAKSFKIDSATQITAVSPAHLPGTVQVQVISNKGAASDDVPADDFKYLEPFTDLTSGSNNPYYAAIIELYNRRIIDGSTANGKPVFKPNDHVIRQQFTKMILGALGIRPSTGDVYSFKDVPKQADSSGYPYHFIARCVKQGIIQGYKLDRAGVLFGKRLAAGSYFFPANNMTREQLITMVVRAAEKKGVLSKAPAGAFRNVSAAHRENVRKAGANGLLNGLNAGQNPGSSYNFYANATRGETAQVLYNYLQLLSK